MKTIFIVFGLILGLTCQGQAGFFWSHNSGGGTGPTTPTVTTASISSIDAETATGGGNVTADGGATVSVKGICWNTSGTPTLSDTYTTGGDGTGSFVCYLSGLSGCITYYVRAYATNSVGTAYGNAVNFTTLRPGGLNDYILYTQITLNGTTTNFIGSVFTANQACYDWKNTGGTKSLYGATNQTTSISVSSKVYAGTGVGCTVVSDGYYMYSSDGINYYIVYILGGVIQSITSCG